LLTILAGSAIRLKDTSPSTEGVPGTLFQGGEAPWSRTEARYGNRVTEGP
jgi:hypothetical protein